MTAYGTGRYIKGDLRIPETSEARDHRSNDLSS